jgi:hypothetical protein
MMETESHEPAPALSSQEAPMIRRLPDLILLVVLLAGGVWALKTGMERSRLQAEFDRLVRATGDMAVEDPSKVHVRAIPTGDPLHFAWRVYTPANYPLLRRTSTGSSGSSTSPTPEEFIVRLRFREIEGRLRVYDFGKNGSTGSSLGGKALANFLRGRFEQLVVEQLGTSKVEIIDPKEPMSLIRVGLPEAMQAEARDTLTLPENQQFNPVFFTMEMGPVKPKPSSSAPGN